MRFDWYQCTVEDTPLAVLDQVRKLGHEVTNADSVARRWRYQQGWAINHNQRGTIAHVLCGGNGNKPHAIATGGDAHEFAALVKENWPGRHLVTRVDAAQDFNEAGAFDRLRVEAKKVAIDYRLAFPKIEDELNDKAGRTQYMGSPSSDYRVRQYEKGWEEVGKLQALFRKQGFKIEADQVPTITNEATGEEVRPEDWTRQEAQIRPKQEAARRLVSTLTPEQCWGCSPWLLDLAKATMALDLERIIMRTRKVSKDEEALRWMCQQYGAMLQRLKTDVGDYACMGLEIGRILDEQRYTKQ